MRRTSWQSCMRQGTHAKHGAMKLRRITATTPVHHCFVSNCRAVASVGPCQHAVSRQTFSRADLALEGCHTGKPPLGARKSGTRAGDPWNCNPTAAVIVTGTCKCCDRSDRAKQAV